MLGAAAACSVGGGGTSTAVTNVGTSGSGGTSSQPSSKAKMAMSLHVPAATANGSGIARASSSIRTAAGTIRKPNLISTASNGLEVDAYETNGTFVGAVDFDISGANATPNATCASDGAGGRNCSITITENASAAGTAYYFIITTHPNAPTSNTSGFANAPALDSGETAPVTFTIGGTATISVTLGGTIASLKLNVPQSLNAFIYPVTVPIGVVAFDAAGDVIVSTSNYSNSVTLQLTNQPSTTTTNAALSLNGGPAAASVTSTSPSDIITLLYMNSGATVGEVFTVTATAGTTGTAQATLAPLFVTATSGTVTGTAIGNESVDSLTETTANASDTVTLTEGATFGGTFTITTDPNDSCGVDGPFTFIYGESASSTPPSPLSATNGQVSFTIATSNATTTGNGCVYDIADGSGTVVPLQILTNFSNGNGNGNYNADVPAGLLYVSAFSDPSNTSSVVANPTSIRANGAPTNASILMVAPQPTAGATAPLYQIADTNLKAPLGVAHDTAGDVFVADYQRGTVDEYVPADIAAYPAPAATAYAYYAYPSPAPGPSAEPAAPDGLAYNAKTGVLYVVDYAASQIYALSVPLPPGSNPQARHRRVAARTTGIHRLATAGPGTTPATVDAIFNVGSGTNHPAAIAIDSSDNLYVSFPQTGVVEKYASVDSGYTGGNTYTLTPTATIGGSGSGLSSPSQVSIGTDGTIFVGDTASGNVIAFNPSNITAGTAIGTQSPAYGFGLIASAAATDTVMGLGFDGNGNLELQPGGTGGIAYGTTPTFPSTANQYLPFATY